ncbi:MAG: PQQ-binding-like beta-propeller repeat protein, partial [Candidatus Bathyarchaeota archaeon]|nr:PQQ-binding-like beta-propeller repeat protein [Candidatus Bathyarchaeota archaeon]
MKISRSESKVSTVALVLVLTIAATVIIVVPVASAQQTFPTVAYLSFRPNPIGVGQNLLVNVWVTPGLPAVRGYEGYVVTITDPDGNVENISLPRTHGDGTQWFEYVPDKVGKWYLQFSFPGQTFPAELIQGYIGPVFVPEQYFPPASTEKQELVVQQDPVPSWPPADLPTDYWTRPINPENREWYTIAGDWLMRGHDDRKSYYNQYSLGPNSAHILWKEETARGGIIGGEGGTASYTGVSSASVVIAGLTYYNALDGTHCIDLHTGKELWCISPSISITAGWYEGSRPQLISLGSRLRKYDAYTGALNLDVPGMSGNLAGGFVYSKDPFAQRLIKWSPTGSSSNFTSRVVWNVTCPLEFVYSWYWEDVAVTIGYYFTEPPFAPFQTELSGAINTTTGDLLWNRTLAPDMQFTGEMAAIWDGKWMQAFTIPARVWQAIDIYTGDKAWTSETLDYPWGGFWAYQSACAYDKVYACSLAGVYCFDVETGKVEWKYTAGDSGFETPYGTWSFFSGPVVADGKVYAANSEHSPTQPLTRGWKLHCIDALTGDSIWNLTGSI